MGRRTFAIVTGLAVIAIAVPVVAQAQADERVLDTGPITGLDCSASVQDVDQLHLECDGTIPTKNPAAATTTVAATTTTVRPTTTTAAPATTTTAPPSGSGFTDPFNNLSAYTASYWRQQWDEPYGGQYAQSLIGKSNVTTSGSGAAVECAMQNYGDCLLRLNRPWTGNSITITATSADTAYGNAELFVADAPYSSTAWGQPEAQPVDNTAGYYPANGFGVDLTCGRAWSWRNGVQTRVDLGGGCVRGATSTFTITRNGTAVTVKRGTTTLGTFQTGLTGQGWLSFGTHNHATIKYGSFDALTSTFDNLSLDAAGPALSVGVAPSFALSPGGECRVLANLGLYGADDVSAASRINVTVNGHVHTVPFPGYAVGYKPSTYSLSTVVPCSELAATNTITLPRTGVGNDDKVSVGNVQVIATGGAPSSTTTVPSTAAPTTTSTSTLPPVTTLPSTTSTLPATTVPPTTPPTGGQFTETFADPAAFNARFDHGFSGELLAGSLFGDEANDWQADHNMDCADPNTTSRPIHIPRQGEPGGARDDATGQSRPDLANLFFYPCLPAADPAKGHVMTSVNTEGYAIAWFTPKQTFSNVHQVCWDQNLTALGGGKWTQVIFATQAEYQGQTDLGFTSPEFPNNNGGPSTSRGAAQFGVKLFGGGAVSWATGTPNGADWNAIQKQGPSRPETGDKAARYQTCVVDNENGTLTWNRTGPNGAVTMVGSGQIPNGTIRVIFEDDNYNPDKHFSNSEEKARDSSGLYTWHWDNIAIS